MRLEGTLPEGDVKVTPCPGTCEKDTTAFKRPYGYPHKSATAGNLCPLAKGGAWSRLTMNAFTTCQAQGQVFCMQHVIQSSQQPSILIKPLSQRNNIHGEFTDSELYPSVKPNNQKATLQGMFGGTHPTSTSNSTSNI